MARSKRQRQKGVPDARLLAERELARGNFKQALKHAKVCYRAGPDESSRCLLQQAFLARCRQLRQEGLLDQARACLQELVALGSPPAGCADEVARLEVLLGAVRTAHGATGHADHERREYDPQLLAALADQTLCYPDTDVGAPRQLRDDAAAIRGALVALETDAVAQAHALLGTVARGSPLADWKLFARGLAAYYGGDRSRMLANWSRLDAQRPACRIANALLVLANEREADRRSADVGVMVSRLTHALESQPILTTLSALIDAWRTGDWLGIVRRHRELVHRANGRAPDLVARVTEIVWRRMVSDDQEALVADFVRYAPPPPVDPTWNRLWALLADQTRDPDRIQDRWSAYLEDLAQHEIFRPDERPVAVALVCHHVAGQLVELAGRLPRRLAAPFWSNRYIEHEIRELQQCACYWFDRCLANDGTRMPAAMDYAHLCTAMGETRRATEIYTDLCHRLPDAFDAWMALASHLVELEEFAAAKPPVQRALVLRPRSSDARGLMWTAGIGLARQAALVGQFVLAHRELDEASAYQPQDRDAYLIDVHRAAVAYKQRNLDDAAQHLERVLSHFDQPAAGLLVAASQVARYRANRAVRKALNDRLQAAARGRPTSQSAGAMARYLHAMTVRKVEYFGLKTHRQVVCRYLNRCGRIRWDALDLRDACRCARDDPAQPRLLRKLVRCGRWWFANDPHFFAFEGLLQIDRGPLRANRRKARRCFEKAFELSKEGATTLDPDLQEQCSVGLSLLDGALPGRTPFHGFDPFADQHPQGSDEDNETDGDGSAGLDFDDFPDQPLDLHGSKLPPEIAVLLRFLSRELDLDPKELLRRIAAGEMPPPNLGVRRRGLRRGATRRANA